MQTTVLRFISRVYTRIYDPDTSIPDEQLVSGYKWIQLVSGLHVSWCKRVIAVAFELKRYGDT